MSFPDGRVKAGLFENNIYKAPASDIQQQSALKAQALLMNSKDLKSTTSDFRSYANSTIEQQHRSLTEKKDLAERKER